MEPFLSVVEKLGYPGVMALMCYYAVRYFVKSAEKKNNIIGSYIKENTEASGELRQAVKGLEGVITQNTKVLEHLQDVITTCRHSRK